MNQSNAFKLACLESALGQAQNRHTRRTVARLVKHATDHELPVGPEYPRAHALMNKHNEYLRWPGTEHGLLLDLAT